MCAARQEQRRYVYFPGTQGDSAFFENNDQMLLARVEKTKLLERDAYEFYNGVGLDGSVYWTTDSTVHFLHL